MELRSTYGERELGLFPYDNREGLGQRTGATKGQGGAGLGRLYIVGLSQGHPPGALPRNHVLVGADGSERLTAGFSKQETPKSHVTSAFKISILR